MVPSTSTMDVRKHHRELCSGSGLRSLAAKASPRRQGNCCTQAAAAILVMPATHIHCTEQVPKLPERTSIGARQHDVIDTSTAAAASKLFPPQSLAGVLRQGQQTACHGALPASTPSHLEAQKGASSASGKRFGTPLPAAPRPIVVSSGCWGRRQERQRLPPDRGTTSMGLSLRSCSQNSKAHCGKSLSWRRAFVFLRRTPHLRGIMSFLSDSFLAGARPQASGMCRNPKQEHLKSGQSVGLQSLL